MREIKFRGMSKRTGKFVYGCYIKTDVDAPAIVFGDGEQEEVRPDTVGQFTGLRDKNGVEIYGGDLMRAFKPNTSLWPDDLIEVRWHDGRACWAYWVHRFNHWATGKGDVPMVIGENRSGRWCEVIGNIHENPELLESKS
ncbi:MAG: hypothetical protein GY862_27170 [Gammaproteobacteria bacterium]|nr:hypothetical protein [Gammaproteobacteria bacterium]MCP5013881.1 hypothetical protein [Ketobacter sp.]